MKVLVRLAADLTVKSDRIRAKFVSRMLRNIQHGFKAAGVEASINRQWSRLFIETDNPAALDLLRRTFGIGSYSVVEHECSSDIETIVALGGSVYAELVAGKTFAVRARRIGTHAFTSMDVAKALGARLRPGAKRVDLASPEVEIFVETREGETMLYTEQVPCPSGLPLGVSGRALCLISGGFDSAVAAWRMQKRGVEMDYVFCNLAGPSYERSVLGIAKLLADRWGMGSRAHLHVLDFQPVVQAIRDKVKPSHAQVILKRMFYRVSERLAEQLDCLALLTGECVGQVSSQTLRNLVTIEAAIDMPILRPLIGFDKDEILVEARRIGTFSMSSKVQEYCQLVPDKPATACRTEGAVRQEAGLDVEALVVAALGTRKSISLAQVTEADLAGPYLQTSEIGKDSVVVDCRPVEEFELWHYPGARNLELHELLQGFGDFDKRQSYVLYCPVGLQSAVAAEAMQSAGYQAYSFRGGVRALRDMVAPPASPVSQPPVG